MPVVGFDLVAGLFKDDGHDILGLLLGDDVHVVLVALGRDGLGGQDMGINIALRVESLVIVGLRVVGRELSD